MVLANLTVNFAGFAYLIVCYYLPGWLGDIREQECPSRLSMLYMNNIFSLIWGIVACLYLAYLIIYKYACKTFDPNQLN